MYNRYCLLLCFLVPLFFSCKGESPAEKFDEKLVVMTPNQQRVFNEYGDAFKKYYKDKTSKTVKIEWLDVGGSSDNLKFVLSEFNNKPDGIDIDVYWGGGVTTYTLKEKGFLKQFKVADEILKKIPLSIKGTYFYDPEFYWYGTALSSFGFVCNQRLLDLKKIQRPKTWEGLGAEHLTGLIAAVDPRHSGVAHVIYSVILQAYGWEKGWNVIMRIASNVNKFLESSSGILKEVVAGDALCGPSIDFYAWVKIGELGRENISFCMPENLTMLSPDPIALLKGAPNEALAKEFISFVLSEQGQSLLMLPVGHKNGPVNNTIGRMSVLPELYTKYEKESIVPNNPFKLKGFIEYNENESGKLWKLLNDMIGTLVITPKKELAKAFTEIKKSGMNKQALDILGSVPVDKKTALKYAENWDNEIFRNKTINSWQQFNRNKFKKIKELLK